MDRQARLRELVADLRDSLHWERTSGDEWTTRDGAWTIRPHRVNFARGLKLALAHHGRVVCLSETVDGAMKQAIREEAKWELGREIDAQRRVVARAFR